MSAATEAWSGRAGFVLMLAEFALGRRGAGDAPASIERVAAAIVARGVGKGVEAA